MKNIKENKQILIPTWHSALAVLSNQKRVIHRIYMSDISVAKFKKLPIYPKFSRYVELVSEKELSSMFKENVIHQGIAVLTNKLAPMSMDYIINSNDEKMLVLLLDQVQDPRNVGAIIRTAGAFGVKAIIMQDKNSPSETESLARAAVGALELVPIIRVVNIARSIELLKNNGFWSVALTGHTDSKLSDIDNIDKTLLIVGNEGDGVRQLVLDSADFKAKIEINQSVESLNVSTAVAIALYDRHLKSKT